MDQLIGRTMRRWMIPGLSLAVVRDGQIICARGFGLADIAAARPATEQTVYPLASITKIFTATAVMLLVEDGVLELDRGRVCLLQHRLSSARGSYRDGQRANIRPVSGRPGDVAARDISLGRGEVLRRKSLQEMWRPLRLPTARETGYGLGWAVNEFEGQRVVGHSGGDPGFATCYSHFVTDRITVVVLANRGGNFFLRIHEAMFKLTCEIMRAA